MGEQRQAFEAYYRKRFKDEPGDNWHTRDCWREWKPAWQAATERAAGIAEREGHQFGHTLDECCASACNDIAREIRGGGEA